jgi:thiamine biosynthesis lipoprotein
MTRVEEIDTFECFGSVCSVCVTGDGDGRSAREAAARARRSLLAWHAQFSRFLPDSELSSLNADPRAQVPASALMVRLAQATHMAGALSGGLVDATLVDEIEHAGYATDLRESVPLATALELAPPRRPAAPAPAGAWRQVAGDADAGTVARPPGVKLDSGGLAKGLFADALAAALDGRAAFAISCGGDVAIGGAARLPRPIEVESPFDGSTLHTFQMSDTAVATSGIGKRSWLGRDGQPAHHLLDPSTGCPAYTGLVQVTALAPSALMAEILAKAAILSGPRRAARWLRHGGVIVHDDGSHEVFEPPRTVALSELSAYAQRAPALVAQNR